jgi:serine/threonine protein kinase
VASAVNKIESPPSSPTEVIVGSWFQLRECIAQSNGIRTHLGRSIDDGHAVVIKVIPAAAVHPGALMRLEYEATHLQRLQSPWLAQIVYVGRENGDLLLVYEHVAGVALRECLESRRLSVNESLSVGRGIFSGLRDMHQHRLLHRGVRPSNIVVDHCEQVTKRRWSISILLQRCGWMMPPCARSHWMRHCICHRNKPAPLIRISPKWPISTRPGSRCFIAWPAVPRLLVMR